MPVCQPTKSLLEMVVDNDGETERMATIHIHTVSPYTNKTFPSIAFVCICSVFRAALGFGTGAMLRTNLQSFRVQMMSYGEKLQSAWWNVARFRPPSPPHVMYIMHNTFVLLLFSYPMRTQSRTPNTAIPGNGTALYWCGKCVFIRAVVVRHKHDTYAKHTPSPHGLSNCECRVCLCLLCMLVSLYA